MRGTAQDYLSNNNRMPYDQGPKNYHKVILAAAILLGGILYTINKSFSETIINQMIVKKDQIFQISLDRDSEIMANAEQLSIDSWKLVTIEDPGYLALVSEKFIPNDKERVEDGFIINDGSRVFTFKALKPGIVKILFELRPDPPSDDAVLFQQAKYLIQITP